MADTMDTQLPFGHELTGHPTHHALTVYGSDACEDTTRARALLDTVGVEYNYYDVDKDAAMARTSSSLQDGGEKTPVIDFGEGVVLVEPTNEELTQALERSGRLPQPE